MAAMMSRDDPVVIAMTTLGGAGLVAGATLNLLDSLAVAGVVLTATLTVVCVIGLVSLLERGP